MIGSTTVFYHQKCKLELSYASMFHRLRFILFEPFIPSGLSHFYQLHESISSLHGLRYLKLNLLVTDNNPSGISVRKENEGRNYFMTNLHQIMGPDRVRTRGR